MKKEKIILVRVDEELHTEYKKVCKKNGLNMSQRIRNYIINEIENLKSK